DGALVAHADHPDAGIGTAVEQLKDVTAHQGEERLHAVNAEAISHQAATVRRRGDALSRSRRHAGSLLCRPAKPRRQVPPWSRGPGELHLELTRNATGPRRRLQDAHQLRTGVGGASRSDTPIAQASILG